MLGFIVSMQTFYTCHLAALVGKLTRCPEPLWDAAVGNTASSATKTVQHGWREMRAKTLSDGSLGLQSWEIKTIHGDDIRGKPSRLIQISAFYSYTADKDRLCKHCKCIYDLLTPLH